MPERCPFRCLLEDMVDHQHNVADKTAPLSPEGQDLLDWAEAIVREPPSVANERRCGRQVALIVERIREFPAPMPNYWGGCQAGKLYVRGCDLLGLDPATVNPVIKKVNCAK